MKIPFSVFMCVTIACVGAGCGHTAPSEKIIDVPFTTQAPSGDWSEPWQNACEETSIYMVSSFYTDDPIKQEEAVRRIKEIVQTKNEEFQVSEDESLEKIAELIKTLELPFATELVREPTIEDLTAELAEGRPIIVPVFAPALASPAYQSGGPDYHVLVLTGYDDESREFIANDPGTEQGEDVRFRYDTFMNAIHDLHAKDYEAGEKAVLFTRDEGLQSWLEAR